MAQRESPSRSPGTSPPPPAAVASSEGETQDSTPDYRLFRSPKFRAFTPVEAEEDPAIIIVLSDEAMLGQILSLPNCPIPPHGRGPSPNTAAVKQWARSLVATHCRAVGAVLEPEAAANPPLADNVLLFHQLKGDEVQSVVSYLGVKTTWAAELLRRGLSGGHLFTVVPGGGGRRASIMHHHGVPPFIAL